MGDAQPVLSKTNLNYCEYHPDMSRLLNKFVDSARLTQPSNLVKFGIEYFSSLNAYKGPVPIVIAGPSGVGKGWPSYMSPCFYCIRLLRPIVYFLSFRTLTFFYK
jgi:hypothetical protein